MNFKEKVEALLQTFLQSREDLFLLELNISPKNDIVVILDGDSGVTLQDCLDASRAIENNLDREVEDFSLQVMSAGLSEPLVKPRQFVKNIGRNLEVMLNDSKTIEGKIIKADEKGVSLLIKYRKPKEVGKGKVDVEEEITVLYTDIKKALVVVQF